MSKVQKLTAISLFRNSISTFTCSVFLAIADALAWLLVYLVVAPTNQMSANKFAIMAAAWCAWSTFVRMQYSIRHSYWTELGIILQGIFMLAFVGSLLKAIIGNADSLLAWWIACLLLAVILPLFRALVRVILFKFGFWTRSTVVFGGRQNAVQAVLAMRGEAAMGYLVSAVALPRDSNIGGELLTLNCPLITWPETREDFEQLRGHHCVIALEADEFELRDHLIRQLSQYQVRNVYVIPAMRGVPLFGLVTTNLFKNELLIIHIKNNLSHLRSKIFKRSFDIFGSIALLLVLSPLFAWLAYKISRDGGSPFFGHKRVGREGKEFYCYKFRSMIINAEEVLAELLSKDLIVRAEWERDFKLKSDPRVNKVGRFIRRTSLDELPQLWNVLKGDMSLVGPRPVVRAELERYGADVMYYLMVNPGMTGLWQVSGRNNIDYQDRVYLDSWYVKNWSLWTDLVILFKTFTAVIGRSGAY